MLHASGKRGGGGVPSLDIELIMRTDHGRIATLEKRYIYSVSHTRVGSVCYVCGVPPSLQARRSSSGRQARHCILCKVSSYELPGQAMPNIVRMFTEQPGLCCRF
jgi:hypothetical protein